MQKTTSVLLGALVLAVAALIIWRAGPRRAAIVVPPMASAAHVATAAPVVADAGADAADILDEPSFGLKGGRPGFVLLDGGKPPELGEGAASAVKFGVVLIQYRGAQRAERDARSKAEALKLASSLVEDAKKDFDEAVQKGDPGSTANAGWMPRGVLEPAPDYLLFAAAKGDVVGPVDTPTGYWVMKNLGK